MSFYELTIQLRAQNYRLEIFNECCLYECYETLLWLWMLNRLYNWKQNKILYWIRHSSYPYLRKLNYRLLAYNKATDLVVTVTIFLNFRNKKKPILSFSIVKTQIYSTNHDIFVIQLLHPNLRTKTTIRDWNSFSDNTLSCVTINTLNLFSLTIYVKFEWEFQTSKMYSCSKVKQNDEIFSQNVQ